MGLAQLHVTKAGFDATDWHTLHAARRLAFVDRVSYTRAVRPPRFATRANEVLLSQPWVGNEG
jgi:hypothetical protein